MKKLTILLSVLMVALTSVFAQTVSFDIAPSEKDFGTVSIYPGDVAKDSFDFDLDTMGLPAVLENPVIKGGLDGVVFTAKYVTVIDDGDETPYVRVTYTANKKGNFEDSIFFAAGALKDTVVVKLKVEEKAIPVIDVASSYSFGSVEFADAKNGITNDIAATVSEGTISVAVEGDDAAAFTVSVADGKLYIKFQPAKPEVRAYAAKVVLSAPHAESKDVTLSASVKMPKPELSVLPTSWTEKAMLINGVAKAEKVFSISGLYLFSLPQASIQGGESSPFKWDAATSKVTFSANAAKLYQDTLVITADNADPIKVGLEVDVKRPVIVLDDDELDFGTISLADALSGNVSPKTTNVSISTGVKLNVAVSPATAPFSAKIEDSKLIVSFKSQTVGSFTAKAVISAADAEDAEVELSASVTMPTPELKVLPVEWKDTVEMENSCAKAERQISIIPVYIFTAPSVTIQGGAKSPFAWDAANSKVTFEACYREATYQDTLIVSALGVADVKVPLEVTVVHPSETKIAVTGVTLDPASAEMEIGDIIALNAVVAPANATDKSLAWESSNAAVATVDNGLVTAVAKGKATIIVRTVDGNFAATCTITVKEAETPVVPVAVTGVTLDKKTASIEKGQTLTLTATVAPANADNKAVTWASSNTAVATVANGVVTAVAVGTATITVKTVDGGFTATCAVTVTDGGVTPPPAGATDVITYVETGLKDLAQSGYKEAAITNMPSGAEYLILGNCGVEYIQMRTSDSKSGFVTTKSAGTVQSVEIKFNEKTTDRTVNIYGSNTAYTSTEALYAADATLLGAIGAADDNKKLTISGEYQYIGIRSNSGAVYIDEIDITWGGGTTPVTPVAVTGVTLDKTTASIEKGSKLTLKATIAPADATNKAVTWESSNTAVATVANGVVTAVAVGTATITVKTADGGFTATCAVTVTEGTTPPTPSGKVDQITYANSGMKGEAKSYADITISGMPSGATYILNAYDGASGVSFIQIRSNNNNSGLVTTKSEGSVLSVEIKFNAKTTDRKVNIYGSNTAFTSPTELYADGLTQLGTIGAGDANKKLTITGDYKYIGIRSADGTVYIDEIDIEYGNFEEKATTTLKFKTATAEVEVGKTVALEVERDGNDAITWMTSDASIATVANGIVTGVKEGTVKITATANNISDECTVTVMKAATPDELPVKSIAEFIAAQGGKCKLIGIVGKIDNDLYGNFNLTDNSGPIYVYGLLTASGESKKFNTLGVAEGDTLTVIAETYKLYNDKPEVINAIFVEVKKGSGVTPTHHDGPLDVNYAEAAYLEDEKGPFWEVFAAKIDDENSMDYPLLIMHIDNTNKTHLAGEFNAFYTVLYMSENDSIESADSKVVIRCVKLAADELSAPVYHFIDTLHDEAGKEYIYEFETEVWAYDRKDSTNEEIIRINLKDPVQGNGENETTYTITTEPNNPEWGTTSGDKSALYLDEIEISATPNYGYHFIQWSDGEKVNPRTVIITQDTIFEAVFAPDTTGTCGKNYALTWAYNASTKTLTISGNGSFDEHMECGIEAKQDMEKLVINEGVTALGAQAFSNCANLTFVQLPASLKTIGEKAFYNCLELTSIYNYRPNPCLIETNTFEKVNTFDCVLYVLAESIAKYRSEASGWKIFYEINPIGGTAVDGTITDVETQPNDNHVVVTWPVSTDAATYTIQITKNGIVFCTLIFDASGQLTGIAFAPDRNSRNHAPAAAKTSNGGLRFTVTGLDGGTQYHLTVDAKDKNGDSVASYETSFETLKAPEVATTIDQITNDQSPKTNKIIKDNQILILRGDKTYTLQGQEVK